MYVNEMVVKSTKEDCHLDDLQETFETLCLYDMKLNCSEAKHLQGKKMLIIIQNAKESL